MSGIHQAEKAALMHCDEAIVTAPIFEAFLNCPRKCWLITRGEVGSANPYATWCSEQIRQQRLQAPSRIVPSFGGSAPSATLSSSTLEQMAKKAKTLQPGERIIYSPVTWLADNKGCQHDDQPTATSWRTSKPHSSPGPSMEIDGIECVRLKDGSCQFLPFRFSYKDEIGVQDRLLLAFDAFVLSRRLRLPIKFGRFVYGDHYTTKKISLSLLTKRVSRNLRAIRVLLASGDAPEPISISHCAECEFHQECRQKLIAKEDISLLANLSSSERNRYHKIHISTITQLADSFRPRRHRKNRSIKPKKYSHAIKARAVTTGRTHIAGDFNFSTSGTPVYVDVEAIPNKKIFYYLIGVRIEGVGEPIVHSLWIDTSDDEQYNWLRFCAILNRLEKPILIHYGSYETIFFRNMQLRYSDVTEIYPNLVDVFGASINVVSLLYATVYFPTYSNGLKEIASYLGYRWGDPNASGLLSIMWRREWEMTKSRHLKSKLAEYNLDDCTALSVVVNHLRRLSARQSEEDAVWADKLADPGRGVYAKLIFQTPELDEINKAAYWDYQRERVLARSAGVPAPRTRRSSVKQGPQAHVNSRIELPVPKACIKCSSKTIYRHQRGSKMVINIRLSQGSVKRWITIYKFYYYRCPACRIVFRVPFIRAAENRYGSELRSLCVYQNIYLRMSQGNVAEFISTILSIQLTRSHVHRFKTDAAQRLLAIYDQIITSIVSGALVHADETQVSLGGVTAYVWVITNLDQVVYLYSPSREGSFIQKHLRNFKGVLVTDFYAAYESIACPQQKCLIHLIRDLNDVLYSEPFNIEFKCLVANFSLVLRAIIATIDQFGLKRRHLKKHKKDVDVFFSKLAAEVFISDAAIKCQHRFLKNRDFLFTFLDYDNIPWNNNNAEHAIKTFVLLRRGIDGLSTEKGIKDYLVLLSISETCKLKNVSFLDFLQQDEPVSDLLL
ncbi:TM0106 family RecB-like putative nuclease [Paraburkholderia sediminicola]|uniref:TM0106 family RecB-like putative nuclease n=1 Tax=Paraburkholderia sediminicola TaxID=458836 RepID=UPI0038B9ADE9